MTIDANGLRTVDDWTTRGATRLLFLGDSVTWGGTRIDDRETFVHLAGRDLEHRLGGRIAAGNAGVNGYGTENIRARVLARMPEADILVVVLLPEDALRGLVDLRGSYFFEHSPAGPLPALWEGTLQAAYWIGSLAIRPPRATSRANRIIREGMAGLLAAVWVRQCEGAHVLLVLTPYRDDVFERASPLTRQVRRHLIASGLPFLDLTAAARSEADAPLYLDGAHLDRAGHALWAHAIADALVPIVTDQRSAAAAPPEVRARCAASIRDREADS